MKRRARRVCCQHRESPLAGVKRQRHIPKARQSHRQRPFKTPGPLHALLSSPSHARIRHDAARPQRHPGTRQGAQRLARRARSDGCRLQGDL
ncbi:hypothetical protein [Pandoravirus japonicus]|uniref:Uncharacterized protein n=1 Tax=Pandoravirus japonicus TaxID=2823154 RepID=A0A811BS56_9VIRU|nr:hypothetical protein [Pandoravirus japonicus]